MTTRVLRAAGGLVVSLAAIAALAGCGLDMFGGVGSAGREKLDGALAERDFGVVTVTVSSRMDGFSNILDITIVQPADSPEVDSEVLAEVLTLAVENTRGYERIVVHASTLEDSGGGDLRPAVEELGFRYWNDSGHTFATSEETIIRVLGLDE